VEAYTVLKKIDSIDPFEVIEMPPEQAEYFVQHNVLAKLKKPPDAKKDVVKTFKSKPESEGDVPS
jgi:hypothetical protein